MRKPAEFRGLCGVLNTSLVIVILLFAGMGYFGYLEYGSDVAGSITLNLPPGET